MMPWLINRRLLAPSLSLALLFSSSGAHADVADLKQAIADLGSQVSDKERMDTRAVTKVEVSQVRTWLNQASNAVKEDDADDCRRQLTRVRAQLVLIDHLVSLSRLQAARDRGRAALAQAKQQVARAGKELADKRARVRALKITQPSK